MTQSIIFPFLFNALWQSALFGASALLLIRCLTIHSASARALLWTAAFFLSATVPFTAVTLRADVQTIGTTPIIGAQTPTAGHAAAKDVSSAAASVDLSAAAGLLGNLLLFAWAAGALRRGVILARDHLRITQLRRESTPLPGEAAGVKLPRHVSLRAHADIAAPVATGLLRPAVILPRSVAADLASPAAQSAIAHELAHISRGDLFVSFLEAAVLAFFWWNPILLKMRNAMVENREMACDDRAVSAVADVGLYARSLIGYAERALTLRDDRKNHAALAAVGKPSSFQRRIVRLMSENYTNRARTSVAQLALAGALIAVASAVAAAATPRILIDAGHVAARAALDQPEAASDADRLGRLLVTAISENDRSAADALIAAGANINAVLYGNGTPLIAAVNAGSLEYAKKLIDLGADLDAEVLYDETALISAVRRGNAAMVRLLISAGADVNKASQTENGVMRSPLGEARRLGFGDIERALREAGATR